MLYYNPVLGGPLLGNHVYKQISREAIITSSDNSIIKSAYYKLHFLVFQLASGIFNRHISPKESKKAKKHECQLRLPLCQR